MEDQTYPGGDGLEDASGARESGHRQYHFTPATYLEKMREAVPRYDELQDAAVAATLGFPVGRILELGTGTGETTRRLLEAHPAAGLVGIDASAGMLSMARARISADLRVGRLEDPLPEGTYDLVVSVLAIHHLEGPGKQDLFVRIRRALRPEGRFMLADVVAVERAEDSVTPTTPGVDFRDAAADLLAWLDEAGFATEVTWTWRDLVVLRAEARPGTAGTGDGPRGPGGRSGGAASRRPP